VSVHIQDSIVTDEQFKKAMSHFASGVTIVTTIDSLGAKRGFTASAFSSLSLSPPLILVCLATPADCLQAFEEASQFAVNILSSKHEQLAFNFAKKGADKFKSGKFIDGQSGMPILSDALVSLECHKNKVFSGGDHIIITGLVKHIKIGSGDASVWYENKFHTV